VVVPLLLFVGVFSLYFATAERDSVNVDAYAASAGAWRIASAGTPWFDDLDVKKIGGTHKDKGVNRNGQWIIESPNGHVTAQRMPGPILAGVPFYWLDGDSGTSESHFRLAPAAFAASVLTASAVVLVFLTLRRHVTAPLAVAASLVFAFATPTWTVSANGLWTHPLTQIGVAGAAYGASRKNWWLAGLFLGIGMLGRPHLALVAAVLGLGLAWSRRDWPIALKVATPTLCSLGVVTLWNRVVHGVWSVSGAYTGVVDRATQGVEKTLGYDLWENYIGFLVAFNRGLLIWTPVLLLFVPAVWRARKSLPDWCWWLLLGALAYTFFQIRLADFTGGIFFYGYRHGLELITALVPVLTLSAVYLGRVSRRLIPIVIAVQVAALSLGAVVEGFFIRPALMWRENSFWLALRTNPEAVGGWLAMVVALGALVAIRYVPAPSPAHPDGRKDAVIDPKRASS
jgi:alpha-1,2-mannosyltransferase